MKRLSLAALLPLFAGCLESPDLSVETSAISSCPKWGCNENSPLMDIVGYFHELHPGGIPNAQEMSVLDYRFEPDGKVYHPRLVDGARLVVDYFDAPTNQTVTFSGHELEGGWFEIQSPSGIHKLIVEHVTPQSESAVTFWVGATTRIETYRLTYLNPGDSLGGKKQELCNHAPPQDKSGTVGEGTWLNAYEAFFFTGDRYDADHKLVTAIDDTSGFFNIACAGSALAKIHLNRHTSLGSPGPGGVIPSQARRQAMLKMYVSDVCGTGSAWTLKGTPLRFSDSAGWFHLPAIPLQHEAYWRENGATCLDEHRLGTMFETQIHNQCPRLPTCGPLAGRNAYFSSAFPPPP